MEEDPDTSEAEDEEGDEPAEYDEPAEAVGDTP